jgi:TPR repeat protein
MDPDLSLRTPGKSLLILGGIAGAVPFVITMSSSSTSTVNGRVVASHFRDWLAVGGGAVAALCGVLALVAVVRSRDRNRAMLIAAAVGVLALGGYQIARGLGVFAAKAEPTNELATRVDFEPPPPPSTPRPVDPATCADPDACISLGNKLEEANDLAGALTAYTRGCELGGKGSCFNAGLFWEQGKPGPADPVKAVALFTRGCDAGDGDSCEHLALHLVNGAEGVGKDEPRAFELFAKACAGGTYSSCYSLGVLHRDGQGTKVDHAKAIAAFTTGCDQNNGLSCDALALAHLFGEGTKKDSARAVELFEKACAASDGSCANLAALLGEGKVMKKDTVRARVLAEKACAAGSPRGCHNLASIFEDDGRGGPDDRARALELWKQACADGFQASCNAVEEVKP